MKTKQDAASGVLLRFHWFAKKKMAPAYNIMEIIPEPGINRPPKIGIENITGQLIKFPDQKLPS